MKFITPEIDATKLILEATKDELESDMSRITKLAEDAHFYIKDCERNDMFEEAMFLIKDTLIKIRAIAKGDM